MALYRLAMPKRIHGRPSTAVLGLAILSLQIIFGGGALGIPSGEYMGHAEYTMYSCGLGG